MNIQRFLIPHRKNLLLVMICLITSFGLAQVPHPKDVFGFTPGDDYKLATSDMMLDYFQKLDASSDRVMMKEIGKSVLGKPMLLLFISDAENLKELEKWRDVSEKLARARIDDEAAQELASTGKSIVWIDGGLHATEVAGAQMTPLLAHRVVTEESAEMKKIRKNTILLLMPIMNPDGLDIVADWYKKNLNTPFEMTRPPWLYHHYVGHDNNRDWFMNNMPESEAVTNVLYNEWYPQIVYNHHQTGPSWTRIFIPPFADPVNTNIHPGVTTGVNMVGTGMANRFAMKKMSGVVSRVIYSMWWNGGMRTVPYFHNMIGILTETSHATPSPRFYDPKSMPKTIAGRRGSGHPTNGTNIFYPDPWEAGESTFSQPVSYMITASMSVLRTAADMREQWLYNIYQMGRDAIKAGESADIKSFIIPSEQWNQGEEIALVNLLKLGGIEISRATSDFTIGENTYSAGSFIIPANQAFRPYVMDLLTKQTYPERRGRDGKPETPYDLAGWTLPMQMGVRVDAVDEPISMSAKPEPLPQGKLKPVAGEVTGKAGFGYLLSNRSNASVHAVNRLLKDGVSVYTSPNALNDKFDAGTYVVEGKGKKFASSLSQLSEELGVTFEALGKSPSNLKKLSRPKVGLYKSWSASMDEGWTRWLLESYEFDMDTLHDKDVQTGDLSAYNAIILPSQSANRILHGHKAGMMPDKYTGGLGLEGTLALKKFVDKGGSLIALDASSDYLIEQFGLPVKNVVKDVSSNSFFIPGSLVKINMENHPLANGMESQAAASFVRSRAFNVVKLSKKGEGGVADIPSAKPANVEIAARYAENGILMSGWATGEKKYLGGKAAVVNIPQGEGNVVLFGFRPQFRGQPRGTYKLFFNAILGSGMD